MNPDNPLGFETPSNSPLSGGEPGCPSPDKGRLGWVGAGFLPNGQFGLNQLGSRFRGNGNTRGVERFLNKFALLMLLALTSMGCLAAPDADEIMERNSSVSKVASSESEATITLTAKGGGARIRKTYTATKLAKNGQDSSRLSRFLAPADVKGMATLLVERSDADDDIWVYLPSMKKVRRLSANNKRDGFLGTDLSHGDVIGHKVKEWKHRLAREETLDGASCYVVESVPASTEIKESSGYARRLSWVRMDNFVATRTDYWDESGELLKSTVVSDIRLIDKERNKWQPMQIVAANKQTGHSSVIKLDTFVVNARLSESLFTPRGLDRGE